MQRNPRTELGSRKNSRDEARNNPKGNNGPMTQSELNTEMLMSFGEPKAKSGMVVGSNGRPSSKRFKLNGRPCTSGGGSGSHQNTATPKEERTDANLQKQMALQESHQIQGKSKNLTEHSVDRVSGERRHGQQALSQNQSLLPHGGRFMTD